MGGTQSKDKFQKILDDQGEAEFLKAAWNHIKKPEDYDDLRDVDFDFECLAFEGGGAKGTAYAGGLKALEDLGILKNIKRVSGTSAGAYTALQVAVGLTADEMITDYVIQNLGELLYDAGYLRFVRNILSSFGWHTGAKVKEKAELMLERKLGKKRITFKELYEKTGRELCVITTALNTGSVVHCHPKLTPNMDVADAVRTSTALPVLWVPKTVKESNRYLYYVDGGLLLNYPIRVFDGWYLSMKPEDGLFKRIDDGPSTYFQGINKKSIGMVVFSQGERQMGGSEYLKRCGDNIIEGRPETPLSIERKYTIDLLMRITHSIEMSDAAKKILRAIVEECKMSSDSDMEEVSLDVFIDAVLKAKERPDVKDSWNLLFSEEIDVSHLEKAFNEADVDGNGKLSLIEVLNFLKRRGINLSHSSNDRAPAEIVGLGDFVGSMLGVMMDFICQLLETPEDTDRTIGIYTDYVTTTDLGMTMSDKVFMLHQGYKATLAFLRSKKSDGPTGGPPE